MVNYPNYQINMARGDTLSFGLEFEGLGQNLDSAFFTVKKNALDEEPIFQKTLANGITKQEDYVYIVRVAPDDTEDLDAGQYAFDMQVSANGDVYTIMTRTNLKNARKASSTFRLTRSKRELLTRGQRLPSSVFPAVWTPPLHF